MRHNTPGCLYVSKQHLRQPIYCIIRFKSCRYIALHTEIVLHSKNAIKVQHKPNLNSWSAIVVLFSHITISYFVQKCLNQLTFCCGTLRIWRWMVLDLTHCVRIFKLIQFFILLVYNYYQVDIKIKKKMHFYCERSPIPSHQVSSSSDRGRSESLRFSLMAILAHVRA